MLLKVRKTIRKYSMLSPGDVVVAAVSGGVDSVALVNVLARLRSSLSFELSVAHFNHRLRGEESDRDEEFVRDLARKLGLGCSVGHGRASHTGKAGTAAIEETARSERYAFLKAEAARRGGAKIATGHTLDDQAETVLMRFLRGSGPAGLAGIPPVNGNIVRPLIETTRDEILSFVEESGLGFVTDSSNVETRFERNWLRHVILPLLRERHPRLPETLSWTAEVFAAVDSHLSAAARKLTSEVFSRSNKDQIDIDLTKLAGYDQAVRAYCLRLAAGSLLGSSRGLFGRHLRLLEDLANSRRSFARARLPGPVYVTKRAGVLSLATKAPAEPAPVPVRRIEVPGGTEVPELDLRIESSIEEVSGGPDPAFPEGPGEEWFDFEQVTLPLSCRTFRPGDRMKPFGIGGTKKLKKLFNEKAIPADLRSRVPLICAGSEIIWVVGVRRSALFPLTRDTRKILKLRAVTLR